MRNKKVSLTVSILLLTAGVALLLLGIFRGEAQTVFEKAVRICLECVGIG